MKDQLKIRAFLYWFIHLATYTQALLCAGARPRLWLSALVLFPFSNSLLLSSIFLTSSSSFQRWEGVRGSPAGWDLD